MALGKSTVLFAVVIVVSVGISEIQADRTIHSDDLLDKVRGMWLGQLIGNAAGRSTEGKYRYQLPNPAESVPWILKHQWDADDDTDIEYIALHILETNGFNFASEDLRQQWLEHITSSGIYIANRQAWFMMGDGLAPPHTGSRRYNEHWYSIDSQITTEILGALSPGMVQAAVDLTGTFARISNEGFPVHAAQLYAAMYATAFFESDVVAIVTQALNAIPATSRTHKVATDVLQWYLEDAVDSDLDWRDTRRKLYDHYQGQYSCGRYYNWLESTINAGATVLALLYGRGDFKETVQIGVLAGWDCDCNPATAGGLIGIISGYSGLPADLTDPAVCGDVYKNVYRPYLPDENALLPQYDTITAIATRIAALAEQNIIAGGGWVTHIDDTKVLHIAQQDQLVIEPDKVDPNGPSGLVGEAIAAGLNVTVSAAVEYHDPDDDRRNLDGIIDGITDNSHNGHKACYSYTSPGQRPQQDWYQLNFSEPVKFTGLTFHEGDRLWRRINEYYRIDDARGGFFEDMTVEILRHGKFTTPVELVMTPALDPFEMYQQIDFTFAPVVGTAIRIIGTPAGSEGFTTIMELEAGGTIETGLYVRQYEINDGHIQRSAVSNIAITFSDDVDAPPEALQLIRLIDDSMIDPEQLHMVYDGSAHQITLTFDTDLDGEFADSLPDDIYELRLDCSAITDSQGTTLLDDDDNPPDGFYTIAFHRLFGDADGSGRVDSADFALMAAVWHTDPGSTGLDANADGRVQITELAPFASNWLVDLAN